MITIIIVNLIKFGINRLKRDGFYQRKCLVGRGSLLRSPFTLKQPAHPTSGAIAMI
ncbi:hypothetical protein [Planktothricoides raciborskii]|uniref:Uncharacterized protein n=1 Tax=Planktothricoides raciborskii GIHE-MW2 TaxID=2792601 RepID=A0AAU8JLU2_9CYAN